MSEGKVGISIIISLFLLALFWGTESDTFTHQQD
jgi:hypothetical protein